MTPARPKVLVAMSGGVDSSVAAALLLREDYDVVGCFMRLGSPGETLDQLLPADDACTIDRSQGAPVRIGKQGCCSINDAADARLVAARLGIPLYVCNFKRDFGRIIDYFADEYAAGRTPNPCVRCNDWLKFGKLHDYARQIGADYVASGHYARVDHGTPGGPRLRRGLDTAKDQSYVLFGVRRDQLPGMLLPIGSMHKARVREVARELGLPVFDKPDSQEICFVPDNDYAALVESRRPDTAREGPIVDTAGKVVGTHPGQHRFTIGQRRGLSLSLGSPVYVVARDAATNTVVVGPREQLLAESCIAAEANFLVEEPPRALRVPVLAKYRYNSPPVHAVMVNLGTDPSPNPSGRSGSFRVTFDQPQAAVAAGQAVVLYDAREPDRVVGGGWIRSVDPLPAPRA